LLISFHDLTLASSRRDTIRRALFFTQRLGSLE